MSRVPLGMLIGLAIGGGRAADAVVSRSSRFLAGAFCARFALGCFAATVRLPLPPVVAGVVVGLLTGAPDAIITKAYAPILVTGLVFGAAAGWIVGRFGAP